MQESLRTIDLNLLVSLQAILKRRSVSQAAVDMGVTQPAMSNTLARLRILLGDQILVRGPGGMVLTNRATALTGDLELALERVAKVVAPTATFDPKSSTRTFTLSVTDYAEATVVPGIIKSFAKEAPGCRLAVRKIQQYTPFDDLASGALELCITYKIAAHAGLKVKRLRSDKFVSVLRKNHPVFGKTAKDSKAERTLTLEMFLNLSHALVNPVSVSRGDEFTGVVDEELKKIRKKRNVAVTIPDFHIALRIAAESDYVVTMPEGLIERSPLRDKIVAYPCPVSLHTFETNLLWHERTDSEPSLTWLRQLISRVDPASE